MATVEPTELVELDVEKVSGVESPANGTTFLVLKASADADVKCKTCGGSGKILDGNRDCPDCDGVTKSDSAETDEMERDLTGDAENDDATIKAKLSSAEQNDLPDSAFAHIESGGEKDESGKTTPRSKRHFPVHDEAHVRNALARAPQSPFGDKAMPKIKAAAKKFGIDVAEKGAVQDALDGTATPQEAGHDPSTGRSGLAGPVTAGAQQLPEPRTAQGGQSTYTIPAEDKQDLTAGAKKTAGAGVAFAVSSIAEAIERLAELRDLSARAEKAGMTLTPPSLDETVEPGNMPWENYDSATLQQVSQCLASCDGALTAIIAREQTEASSVDPSDSQNAWDLQDAQSAMDYALGIVARLSFTEAHEADTADVAKAGRRLSGKTEGVLRAARDHLTSVIGDGDDNEADTGSTTPEGDKIQMELTKSEFAESVVAIAQEVLKNANNGGDISEQDIHDNGKINTLDDALTVAGEHHPEAGVTKEQQDVTKQLKELSDQVGQLGGLVTKMAQQPRRGGPILTGQLPAGLGAAVEGRQGEVAKSAHDQEIEQLTKQLDKTRDPNEIQHLTSQITIKQLANAHRSGLI